MALGTFYCFTCQTQFKRENGEANRTLRKTGYLFCSKTCSGIHRRSLKTTEQKKYEKAEYDRKYRLENKESIKAKKAEYFSRTYDPVAAKEKRKEKKHRHAEYCRSPRYKAYKKKYDQIYRAKKEYGEFWESAVLLNDLEQEIYSRADFTERATLKGTLNKRQTRKRNYEQSINSGTT